MTEESRQELLNRDFAERLGELYFARTRIEDLERVVVCLAVALLKKVQLPLGLQDDDLSGFLSARGAEIGAGQDPRGRAFLATDSPLTKLFEEAAVTLRLDPP